MITIEACNLAKNFQGEHAVKELSLQARQGEILGLVGPNGAGKTTAMLMLVGLLSPDSGEVRLLGRPFSTSTVEARREIGWIPQDLAFYAGLSARENLEFFGKLYGLKGKRLTERVGEVLEISGLGRVANQSAQTLSGGLQRRLNLSLGLVHQPRVLVMDEPTVGIDSLSRSLILEHTRKLSESGSTILLASHYVDEVVAVCDRVIVLNEGLVLFSDTVSALSERLSGGTAIIFRSMDNEGTDQLKELPGSQLEAVGDRFKLTISTSHGQNPIHSAWIVGEALSILKSAGIEIISMTASQPSLHDFTQPPLSESEPKPTTGDSGTTLRCSRQAGLPSWVGWTGLVLLLAGALVALFRPEMTTSEPERSGNATEQGQVLRSVTSPDGKSAAFVSDGTIRVRSQEQGSTRQLIGTEGASGPLFWSPDSLQLVYVKDGKLWKVLVSTSASTVICPLPEGTFAGGTWGQDNSIILSMGSGSIYQVSPDGGLPQSLVTR